MAEAVTDLPSTSHLRLARVAIEVIAPACQRTQVYGGAFQDVNGNPVSNGQAVFFLSADAHSCGNYQVSWGRSVSVTLDDDGNIPSDPLFFLWPNESLSGDTWYTMRVYSEAGELVSQKTFSVPVADQWDTAGA